MKPETPRFAAADASDPVLRSRNHFRFIQWDITSRCNLKCIHCRSESFYGNGDLERDMPLEAVKAKVDQLSARGVRRIHFLGGEPFCRRDLPKIVEHATEQGILCSVNTNGTLITRDQADAIVKAGTYLLTFSIDGPDATSNDAIRGIGSFRKVLRGIAHVRDAKARLRGGTRLVCCHVLMRPNYRRVAAMVDLCTELGLQNLIVSGLRRMGGAIPLYRQLALSQIERHWAAAALAKRLTRKDSRCNVQMDFLGLLEKLYYSAKFRIEIPVTRGGCNAVSTKAYVQPDGTLFPCQDVAKEVQRRAREVARAQGVDPGLFTPTPGLRSKKPLSRASNG